MKRYCIKDQRRICIRKDRQLCKLATNVRKTKQHELPRVQGGTWAREARVPTIYPGHVECSVREGSTSVRMTHGILARDTEEFNPEKGRAADGTICRWVSHGSAAYRSR